MPYEPCNAPRRLVDLADSAAERVRAARRIADACRHDEATHRAAMKAVFVLEDTLFALRQIVSPLGDAVIAPAGPPRATASPKLSTVKTDRPD